MIKHQVNKLSLLQKGFTLIEIMFVITIMAVLTTLGISSYQQKLQNSKIEQSALQFQQWAQASLAYRIANDDWTSDYMVLKNYGIANASSPWCVESTGHACYTIAPVPPGAKAASINISTTVPNHNIAMLLAGRLPNAVAGSNPNTVTMSVTLPVESLGKGNNAIIVDIKNVTTGDYISTDSYNCPPGYNKKFVFFAMKEFRGTETTGTWGSIHHVSPYNAKIDESVTSWGAVSHQESGEFYQPQVSSDIGPFDLPFDPAIRQLAIFTCLKEAPSSDKQNVNIDNKVTF